MCKVYARQVNPEYQDAHLFYISSKSREWVWEDEYYKDIAFMPLRGYYDTMPAAVERVRDVLETGELADVLDDIQRGPGYWGYDAYDGRITRALADYLPAEKANGKGYSTREVKRLGELVSEYGMYSKDETRILCAVLSIMTGRVWDWREIRGCCQGDWREIVFPVDQYDDDDIKRLESEYFNTGTEWIIHDSNDEPKSAEDIDGYSVYCHRWGLDSIRQEIAEHAGCTPEDVEMYKYSGSHCVDEYKKVC